MDIPDNYNAFKNACLNVLYTSLPSYAYFEDDQKISKNELLYWHQYTDEECKKIVNHFGMTFEESYVMSIQKFVSDTYKI